MSKAYCPRCEELRTDNGDDAWGFVWHVAPPVCQRCQSVVEFTNNGPAKEDELEEIDQEEEEVTA